MCFHCQDPASPLHEVLLHSIGRSGPRLHVQASSLPSLQTEDTEDDWIASENGRIFPLISRASMIAA